MISLLVATIIRSHSQVSRLRASMQQLLCALFMLMATADVWAGSLPGFRAELVTPTLGFCSSIAADSHDVLYYTTTRGDVYRLDGGVSVPIAHVGTAAGGNGGLLGIALFDDQTAVVHYTKPDPTSPPSDVTILADVLSRIDLHTGAETVLHEFVCNLDAPSIGVLSEHHGGIPVVADGDSIIVGIGDYAAPQIAPLPQWNGGKLFRLSSDGRVEQLASGFRNPFGMAWDRESHRLIVADNGDVADDELDIVTTGGFYGWPMTAGNLPSVPGAIAPVYTFPIIVAPTGVTALTGANAILRRGFVVGAYVTKALYFVPDIDVRPLPDPFAIIDHETGPIIDVIQAPSGVVYFITGQALYRLVVPQRGDCNGDGIVDSADLAALDLELADGDPHPVLTAQDGSYRGSWGCDVDGDGLISSADRAALWRLITGKVRAVRRW
jgi:glucose/arabinose dehydrogenase